jgi:hypothetical protein
MGRLMILLMLVKGYVIVKGVVVITLEGYGRIIWTEVDACV